MTEQEMIGETLWAGLEKAAKKLKKTNEAENFDMTHDETMGYVAYIMFCTLGSMIYRAEGREEFNKHVKEIRKRNK